MPRMEADVVNVATTTIDADGFELSQHDADGEQGSLPFEAHHPFGVWGRPFDGVTGTDGQVDASQSGDQLIFYIGGIGHALKLGDPRVIPNVPAPAPGETVLYGSAGCFGRFHVDGSVSIATTDSGGDSGGQTVAQRVTPSSFERYAPWGRETFDAMSYRVAHAGGSKLTLGYVSGPGPLQGGQSYARVQAQIVEINGSMVSIGPSGVPAQPVVQAQPLQTILTSISTALLAIQTGVAGIPSGGSAAASAMAPAIAAAVAQIATALEIIATQSAIG